VYVWIESGIIKEKEQKKGRSGREKNQKKRQWVHQFGFIRKPTNPTNNKKLPEIKWEGLRE
jgi:hypothetical protein